MASTAHQTRAQERNSPSRRAGCLPARSLASVLCRLERPVCSPFIESFLLCQIPSRFTQGLGFTLDFPVLPEHRCYHLSFPSVLEVFSSPGQGLPDEPPNVMPDVQIPEREERGPPRQCNSQKGKFIADSSQGSCHIQCHGVGSESPDTKLLHKFIGWAHTVGSWFKQIGYKFAKQFHWSNTLKTFTHAGLSLGFPSRS